MAGGIKRYADNPIYAGDVAELREQLSSLGYEIRASRGRINYLTRGLPVGFVEVDAAGLLITTNDALREMVGFDPVIEGKDVFDLIHPDDRQHVANIVLSSFEDGEQNDFDAEFRVVRRGGQVRVIRAVSRTHFDEDGEYRGVLSTWLDITDEVTAKSASDRFASMLNAIPDPVMIFDPDFALVYTNPAAADAMTPESARTGRYTAPNEASWQVIRDDALPAARRDGHWTGELETFHRDGRLVPYLVSITVQRDPVTGIDHTTSIWRDITSLKAAEQVLRRQATRDVLTGLPNRRALFERLTAACARTDRSGFELAVLFVDLDGFKPVNDAHGHETGDEVLVEVARRFERAVRDGDTVARIGGDEFVVVCEQLVGRDEAEVVAGRIIDAARAPIAIGERQVQVGASVGVAFLEAGSGAADTTAGELVRRADQAVYAAKAAGRGCISVWSGVG